MYKVLGRCPNPANIIAQIQTQFNKLGRQVKLNYIVSQLNLTYANHHQTWVNVVNDTVNHIMSQEDNVRYYIK